MKLSHASWAALSECWFTGLPVSPVSSLGGPCESALFHMDIKVPTTSGPFLWAGLAVIQDSAPALAVQQVAWYVL